MEMAEVPDEADESGESVRTDGEQSGGVSCSTDHDGREVNA